jgi:hypothetical protein
MKTNWVRTLGLVILSFVTASILWNARASNAQAQDQSLKEDVQHLQFEMAQVKMSDLQFRAYTAGRFVAFIYSNDEEHIIFDHDNDYQRYSYYTWVGNTSDHYQVSLVDKHNNVVDSFVFSKFISPGDLMIAWIAKPNTTDKPPKPLSPDQMEIPAWYWNSSTGLAVGIEKIDGTIVQ